MKGLLILFVITILVSCAAGRSTYEYTHNADGSTYVKISSVNEIGTLEIGIDRETGTLEVTVGDMSKKSEVETVVKGFENVTGNIVKALNPASGG